MRDLTGRVAGSYRLVACIGSGAMGDVYKAVHTQDGSAAAVKMLQATLVGDAAVEQRFLREAQAASRVDHPAIIRIDSAGRMDGERPFLVMELLEGTSLDKAAKQSI